MTRVKFYWKLFLFLLTEGVILALIGSRKEVDMLERIVERCDVALIRNIDGCRPLHLVSFQLNVAEPVVRMGHLEIPLHEVSDEEAIASMPATNLTTGYDVVGGEPIETLVRVNGMPNLIGKVVTFFPLGEVVHPHYALALT